MTDRVVGSDKVAGIGSLDRDGGIPLSHLTETAKKNILLNNDMEVGRENVFECDESRIGSHKGKDIEDARKKGDVRL
jgi:hypothetical protein